MHASALDVNFNCLRVAGSAAQALIVCEGLLGEILLYGYIKNIKHPLKRTKIVQRRLLSAPTQHPARRVVLSLGSLGCGGSITAAAPAPARGTKHPGDKPSTFLPLHTVNCSCPSLQKKDCAHKRHG